MSTLFGSLAVSRQALLANQIGLDITQNNIANANTPGYARQRANFEPGDGIILSLHMGVGVQLLSIDSYRSSLLDRRVSDEIQRQGEYESSSAALQQVEAILDETAGLGLQSTISNFFNSFSSLANVPEDAALRQQVLARGEQLGAAFRDTYERIQAVQVQQNRAIEENVAEINTLSASIASLNAEVAAAKGSNSNPNNFLDRRQQLVDKLAGLVDMTYFESESGDLNITTRQGTLLVIGSKANSLQAVSGPDGTMKILTAGNDITATIQSGKLGGLIKVRDVQIASYLGALDDMAAAIVSRVNAQHALGADADGLAGGDFFAPIVPLVPGSNRGAARAMVVAITDTDKIAAADPGAGPGSNKNAQRLAAIEDETILSGDRATLSGFYASLVFRIGLDSKTSMDGMETQSHLLNQLQAQRDSQSGVSLDEEAINLMRYQKAYEASSRFISTLNSLMDDLIRILGG